MAELIVLKMSQICIVFEFIGGNPFLIVFGLIVSGTLLYTNKDDESENDSLWRELTLGIDVLLSSKNLNLVGRIARWFYIFFILMVLILIYLKNGGCCN